MSNLIVGHRLVHKLGAKTTIDFRKPENKTHQITSNAIPVKMQLLKAIRIA